MEEAEAEFLLQLTQARARAHTHIRHKPRLYIVYDYTGVILKKNILTWTCGGGGECDSQLTSPTWRRLLKEAAKCDRFYSVCLFHSMSCVCVCPILQASLNKLMETLGQSEPYFVKCIRSNAEKVKQEQLGRQPL